MELEIYKALAFGKDGLAGDGGNAPSRKLLLDATTELSFGELLELWARTVAAVDMGGERNVDGTVSFKDDDGEIWTMGGAELIEYVGDELGENPVGFWLLTEEKAEIVFMLDEVECWGDSVGYVLIHAQKVLANKLASKVVGDRSPLG